jgi:hypothetical protein
MIKAIETVYKGYRFRSRLEARWAVFMDSLGVDWVYESEGFELDGGNTRYLPDFWIPLPTDSYSDSGEYSKQRGYWLEIKPKGLTIAEAYKCEELVRMTGHWCVALCGQPWPGEFHARKFMLNRDGSGEVVSFPDDYELDGYICYPFGVALIGTDRHTLDFHPAYRAARSARFEFGESGARV